MQPGSALATNSDFAHIDLGNRFAGPLAKLVAGQELDAPFEGPSLAAKVSPPGGESSLAPEVRKAIPDTADRMSGLLVEDRKHTAGADDPSPIVPRSPADSAAASIRDIVQSLKEGFTPRVSLHL